MPTLLTLWPGGQCLRGAIDHSAGHFPAGRASAVLAHISRVEVALGNARHGPWRMNESDFDFVDDPTVAITGDGHIGVAWVDQKRQNIFLQVYTPDGQARFGEPVNVSSNPGIFSWLPRMVIASQDRQHVYALWQEIVFRGGGHGGEILFARSSDGGAAFSEALNLSDSEAGAGKGRLTPERWDKMEASISSKGQRGISTRPGANMRASCG